MENVFDIIKSPSQLLRGWSTRDYIRSNSFESQYISPDKDATSITFYSHQPYYEIFTLEYLCPLRLPLPKNKLQFLLDLNRANIQLKHTGDQA